jgi:hypothetical protein
MGRADLLSPGGPAVHQLREAILYPIPPSLAYAYEFDSGGGTARFTWTTTSRPARRG